MSDRGAAGQVSSDQQGQGHQYRQQHPLPLGLARAAGLWTTPHGLKTSPFWDSVERHVFSYHYTIIC